MAYGGCYSAVHGGVTAVLIANGGDPLVLDAIMDGSKVGTLFLKYGSCHVESLYISLVANNIHVYVCACTYVLGLGMRS